MEEDIKVLKETLSTIESLCTDDCINQSTVIDPLKYAIKNLINRNKELEKHYQHEQEYINGEVFSAKQMHYIENNYIYKDKVREKIEFYKRYGKIKNSNEYVMSVAIQVLEELLQEN